MSSPLRIIYDNAGDRGTLSVTGTPVLPVTNLHTNDKSGVFRTANAVTSATFSQVYSVAEAISAVAFLGNFSATMTMRVRLYSDEAGTGLLHDTTAVQCAQGQAYKVAGLTLTQSASAYSYGGGRTAVIYFPVQQARKIVIDIVDTSNLQGYLEAYRLIVGEYFSPTYNAEMGASVTNEDTSETFRSDAGNLKVDVGTRHKKLSVNLSVLLPADRTAMWGIVSYCGTSQPVLIDLYPENADKELQQAHVVYGMFTGMSAIAANNYNVFTLPLEVEGL